LKRYESRYCTFAVPEDWVAEPPFAFTGKDATGGRWTAQVLERCLLQVLPVATHLRQQAEMLPHLYERFELVSEGPFHPEGTGEGFTLTFRFIDEEESEARAQAFYLALGPLICQLVLAGPDRHNPDQDRLFAAIAKTFAFRQVEFLGKAYSAALTSEILRTSQPSAERGWTEDWRKFPRACVSLPVPSGWEVTEKDGDAIFRRGLAEIRLHRDLEGHGDPSHWFSARMKRLQDSGDLFLAKESGELERGAYAALLYEEKGVGRTWRTAAVTRIIEFFLKDCQSLLWSLKAPEDGFPDLRSLFEGLVAACKFLDPAEWETKAAEPWLDHTFRGPWQVEGPGLYALVGGKAPIFVHLSLEPTTFSLEKLQPSILSSVRQSIRLGWKLEHSVMGSWRHHDSLYYAIDGSELNSVAEVSVRAVWLAKDRRLYSMFIRGTDAEPTEGISRSLLDAFSPIVES